MKDSGSALGVALIPRHCLPSLSHALAAAASSLRRFFLSFGLYLFLLLPTRVLRPSFALGDTDARRVARRTRFPQQPLSPHHCAHRACSGAPCCALIRRRPFRLVAEPPHLGPGGPVVRPPPYGVMVGDSRAERVSPLKVWPSFLLPFRPPLSVFARTRKTLFFRAGGRRRFFCGGALLPYTCAASGCASGFGC